MAKKKPKTLEKLAAVTRQLAANDLDRRFRESGDSRDEFDAQELAKPERQRAEREQRETEHERRETERQQRLRDLSVAVEIQRDGTPDPRDVAHALTLRHRDGKPVKLAALLVESGLADIDDAASASKGAEGKGLVAALRERWWGERTVGRGQEWLPPLNNRNVPTTADAGAAAQDHEDAADPVGRFMHRLRRPHLRRDRPGVVEGGQSAMPALREALVLVMEGGCEEGTGQSATGKGNQRCRVPRGDDERWRRGSLLDVRRRSLAMGAVPVRRPPVVRRLCLSSCQRGAPRWADAKGPSRGLRTWRLLLVAYLCMLALGVRAHTRSVGVLVKRHRNADETRHG